MPLSEDILKNERMNALTSAVDAACEELGISDSDQEKRQRVAVFVMTFGWVGQGDIERLKTYAVAEYCICQKRQ